jgi:hypothetical protein
MYCQDIYLAFVLENEQQLVSLKLPDKLNRYPKLKKDVDVYQWTYLYLEWLNHLLPSEKKELVVVLTEYYQELADRGGDYFEEL